MSFQMMICLILILTLISKDIIWAPISGVLFYAHFLEVTRMATSKRYRPDHDGTHRLAFERNKKKIYATQTVCGICGKPVDFSLKYPHPLSPCIDHIIPVDKGGHPSDLDNLQLAHWACNRQKSDKLMKSKTPTGQDAIVSNRLLPQSCDWAAYRSR